MKILHVIRGLSNSSGTTHIVGPLAEAQARLGHQVSLMHVAKLDGKPVLPDPALVRVQQFPMSLPLNNPGISWPFARAIRAAVRAYDVLHIHAVWNYVTWTAMRAAYRADVPYIVAPQGSLEPWAMVRNGGLKRLYARLTELPLLRRADCLQALSAAEAEQMHALKMCGPVRIVPNGVDPSALPESAQPLAQTLGLPPGARTVLSLSRLHPKKGVDLLIDGFLRADVADLHLVIAGTDAGSGYGAVLQRLAAGADQVHFIGELQGAEKFAALAGADLFALISHSEGLPVAVLEAMGCSTPVLITPPCHIPQAAKAEAGRECAADPAAVAVALRDMFAVPEQLSAMGARGRTLVLQHFTWPRIATQTLEIYENMACRALS